MRLRAQKQLREHLAHWGIDMSSMNKTEKTMAELNIDFNIKARFVRTRQL